MDAMDDSNSNDDREVESNSQPSDWQESWLAYLPSFLRTPTNNSERRSMELPIYLLPDQSLSPIPEPPRERLNLIGDDELDQIDTTFAARVTESIVTLPQRSYTTPIVARPEASSISETSVSQEDEEEAESLPSLWSTRDLVSVQSSNKVKHTKYRIDFNGQRVPMTARKEAPLAKSDDGFFAERRSSLMSTLRGRPVEHIQLNDEVGVLGRAWRHALLKLLLRSYDQINGLQLSRILQLQLPFLTAYESYLTSQVIEALDRGDKRELRRSLSIALTNRNVSRVIVQNLGLRYDFLWHWSTSVTWNRPFDAFGQFPIIGFTAFPATENFPSTRNHALASIFRVVLGEGNWITRIVTSGREGLITDNPKNTAQNLAAESNGFELANRNQYGTYFGRQKTNEFRLAHRLPTDESLVRTFVANPIPTMTNNGVVHVLSQLAWHWHNMLSQEWGNFAHQRMEQLDPLDTLRFHIPQVCVTLSSLRGRNSWDSRVLGPFMKKLQSLRPSLKTDFAKQLVVELKEEVVLSVCGGVSSLVDPFHRWLDAILLSLDALEVEARRVYKIVQKVEMGIRLGHDLVTQVSWKVPACAELRRAVLRHIRGQETTSVSKLKIQGALQKTTPRDMRTLIEMVRCGYQDTKPAQLLLGRVKTLLQRELRRDCLNKAIRDLSMGAIETGQLKRDEWYWVEEGTRSAPHIYIGKIPRADSHRFIHVDSGHERVIMITEREVSIRAYIPIAEAITRAQKAFMMIELEHGKTFSYSAFMEFSFLRVALRRLLVVGAINCEELDNARLNVLREVQRTREEYLKVSELIPGKTYYTVDKGTKDFKPFVFIPTQKIAKGTKIARCPPQSMLVVGGGPTGLITTIHCAESCLATGGQMKLQEARDAFVKGGSTFERAQIVRLDARWISMLRYHLGTVFEDVYIPASGETDSQLGNTLPTQGFVEITIKDLESSLHTEVSRLWSRGIISVYTDAKIQYDRDSNSMTKLGRNLKDGDVFLRSSESGASKVARSSWKVTKLIYTQALKAQELEIGKGYGVWVRSEEKVLPYQLVDIDAEGMVYYFKSFSAGVEDFTANAQNLPSIYPAGTRSKAHAYVDKVVVETTARGGNDSPMVEVLSMDEIGNSKFTMDIGRTHVVEAIGKRPGSNVHIPITTLEPYGVCCMQGLKVSMGMHNFGEKRWGSGLQDDIRSQTDQNTRIIGDFTKMVRVRPIVDRMCMAVEKSKDWREHFGHLGETLQLNSLEPVLPKVALACSDLRRMVGSFRRQTLQTRFFETGDSFYLGMEFNREFVVWKKKLCIDLVRPLFRAIKDTSKHQDVESLKSTLSHHIDRLWYDGCLETIRTGDVYNPGARHRVPRLYLIDSYHDMSLGDLPLGECFRLPDNPTERYEILVKGSRFTVVRNVEGFVFRMKRSIVVRREGNLTRGPDGRKESKVSLATFDVGHYVNHRTARLSSEDGFIFTFIGDEQATPHFMRYSGLTGGCINAMSFNKFVNDAIHGVSFEERLRSYSKETNWSNGEVVQRGTGGTFGEDGFLRPGFSYRAAVEYLYSKILEYKETKQDCSKLLSHDWTTKMAASLVPRGMEENRPFLIGLSRSWNLAIMGTLLLAVEADRSVPREVVGALQKAAASLDEDAIDSPNYWTMILRAAPLDSCSKTNLSSSHFAVANGLTSTLKDIVNFARRARLTNDRVSSRLAFQPKSVDSLVDNLSVEAQNFANSLTQSAAFAAGALAFRLAGTEKGNSASGVLAFVNIAISFSTMTNVARYKIRNEESRVTFREKSLPRLKRVVFSMMDISKRKDMPLTANPFVAALEEKVREFRKTMSYYGKTDFSEFDAVYGLVRQRIHDDIEVERLQRYICFRLMADTYHVNSNVQECLVEICRILYEIVDSLRKPVLPYASSDLAASLFNRLVKFEESLETSLQRGSVRFGFIKRRKFFHWDVCTAIRFLYSLFCCSSSNRTIPFGTIHTETHGIVKATKELSRVSGLSLVKEVQDFEALYWATRESDVASLIYLSGFFVFIASITFTIARLFNITKLEDWAFWANLVSETGAALAFYHLWRKLAILVGLWGILWKKRAQTDGIDRQDIRRVSNVTFTQILLTLTRLTTVGAAAVALPWFVIERGYPALIPMGAVVPDYIALGCVLAAIGATLFFFLVEYVVRFNLNPSLGPFVCELFRSEIEAIYGRVVEQENSFISPEEQEREAWEYTARIFLHKYRFDTVFAADRFGSILQYIQSGMKQRNDFV